MANGEREVRFPQSGFRTLQEAKAERCRQEPQSECSACRLVGSFERAVQRLNSFRENGEVRETEMAMREWKISQVEKLIGLSRRDIQRACYSGKGGVAILQPEDSSWGKRGYSVEDLAKLFVVKCHRGKGMSLVESAEAFRKFDEAERGYSMLDAQVSLMLAQRDELERQIACGELINAALRDGAIFDRLVYSYALRAVVDGACEAGKPVEAYFALLDWLASVEKEELRALKEAVLHCLDAGEAPDSASVQGLLEKELNLISDSADGVSAFEVVQALLCVLQQPSMEPVLELCLGPGSFEFVDEAVGTAVRQKQLLQTQGAGN